MVNFGGSSSGEVPGATCAMLVFMRDTEIIETDLMEISAIADDSTKFERILAWCAAHPDEIPFALHHLMGWREKESSSESPKADGE